MESSDPLPFHWDMEMYKTHIALRSPATAAPFHEDRFDEADVSADSREDQEGEESTEEKKQLHFEDEADSSSLASPQITKVTRHQISSWGKPTW